jgi:hypothetical protein
VQDENHKPVAGALIFFQHPFDWRRRNIQRLIVDLALHRRQRPRRGPRLYAEPQDRQVCHRGVGSGGSSGCTRIALIHERNVRGAYADTQRPSPSCRDVNVDHCSHSRRDRGHRAVILILTRNHATNITTGTGAVGHP